MCGNHVFASCRSGKGVAIRWRYGSLITAECIEHQFYPARYGQFVEYLNHVVPNCVFAQMEVEGNLLVPHSVSDKAYDISFALCQPNHSTSRFWMAESTASHSN